MNSHKNPNLLSREESFVLVVDVQEKLLPVVPAGQSLVVEINKILAGARLFNVPVFISEQYPQGLGDTIPEISTGDPFVFEKTSFSCGGSGSDFTNALSSLQKENRMQCVLVGIESHICVLQTALDLMNRGFDVYPVVDAIGSRHILDHQVAVQRMTQTGAQPVSTESVLFEWCGDSTDPRFKSVSQLVR